MQRTAWLRALAATTLAAAAFTATGNAAGAAAAMSATSGYGGSTVAVGDLVSTSVTVENLSTAPDGAMALTTLSFVPSCGTTGPIVSDCPEGSWDPAVFQIEDQPIGAAGTACAGVGFSPQPSNSSSGLVDLVPAEQVVLQPPGPGNTDTCRVDLLLAVLAIPAHDSRPGTPGIQTDGFGFATGTVESGLQSTASGGSSLTVAAAAGPPGVRVVKVATPLSRPAPGGTFSFGVAVTNTSEVPVTVTSLVDDIYGDVATQGTCVGSVGTALAPGETYSCAFSGDVTGPAGTTQTDVVTATVVDGSGASATGSDDAVVSITEAPATTTTTVAATSTTVPAQATTTSTTRAPATTTTPRLAATGASSRSTGLVAGALVGLGMLLSGVGATVSVRRTSPPVGRR